LSYAATTQQETPFFVRAGGEDIFGVLTEPPGEARNVAAIVLTGGAYVGATNRNRVSVRIARALAEHGYHAVRIDYHGVGDSTGDIDMYPLHRPWIEDILPALDVLAQRGVTRTVLVGTTCFGARTALHAAAHVTDLAGVALYACPLWDFPNKPSPDSVSVGAYARLLAKRSTLAALRREDYTRSEWLAVARWKAAAAATRVSGRLSSRAARPVPGGMSPAFVRPLSALAARGTPLLIGYGLEDDFGVAFQTAMATPRLRAALQHPSASITVRTVPGSIHALRRIAAQDAILAMTLDWLSELDPHGGG
jgi:alpha/beta superfamily hydrolase